MTAGPEVSRSREDPLASAHALRASNTCPEAGPANPSSRLMIRGACVVSSQSRYLRWIRTLSTQSKIWSDEAANSESTVRTASRAWL